jgi:hypothetical protein
MTGATPTVVTTNAQLAAGNNIILPTPTTHTPGLVSAPIQSVMGPTFNQSAFEFAVSSAIQAGSGKSTAESVLLRVDMLSEVQDTSGFYTGHLRSEVFSVAAFPGQHVTSEAFVATCAHMINSSLTTSRLTQGTHFHTNIPHNLKKMFQLEGAKGYSVTNFLRDNSESKSDSSHVTAAAVRYIQLIGILFGEKVYATIQIDILSSMSDYVRVHPIPAEVLIQYFDQLYFRLFSARESARIQTLRAGGEGLSVWVDSFKCTQVTFNQLQSLALQTLMYNFINPDQSSARSVPQPPRGNKDGKKPKATDQKKKPQGKLSGLKGFCAYWLKSDTKPCGNPACKPGSKYKLKHDTDFVLLSKLDREAIIAEANKVYPNEIKVSP